MYFRFILFLFIVGFCFSSCSNSTFDVSSQESFQKSSKEIVESLKEDQKNEIASAIMFYSFQDFDIFSDKKEDFLSGKLKEKLHGKTAEQVLTEYKKDKENSLKKEIQAEIELLENKKLSIEKATELSKDFVFSGTFKIDENYGFKNAYQIIKIKNNSNVTISSFKVDTKLVSTDRKVPWGTDEIYYSIPGGLNSGEAKEFSFSAYKWENLDFGSSIPLLKVNVVFVKDSNEEKIFEFQTFEQEDAEKLQKLKKEL